MKHNYLFYLIVVAAMVCPKSGFAQQEFTLQLMDNLYQSTYVNPATVTKNNFNVTLFTSVHLGVTNTGFSYNQLAAQVEQDENGDQILNLETMLNNLKLDKKQYANLSASVDLFALGFKAGKNRFSLNISEKVNGRFSYDNALLKAAVYGNTPGESIQISNYQVNAIHYHEGSIGYNREVLDDNKLVVGGRLKVLMGLGNIKTEKSEVSITTAEEAEMYAITAKTDVLIKTSGLGLLEGDNSDQYIANTNNLGFGMDMGGTYKLDTKWSFGASLINVGFINWKANNENQKSQGSYTFTGIESDSLFNNGEFHVNTDEILDSLVSTFEFVESNEAYRTGIPAQLYLTAYYKLARQTTASAMLNGSFMGRGFQKGLALGIRQDLGKWFQASATYSMQAKSYNNLGFGLSLNSGRKGMQLYIVTDNILAAINPGAAKMANVRTGLNFAF